MWKMVILQKMGIQKCNIYDNREIPNTIGTSDLHDVLWEELEPIGNIHDKEE